jgi:CHAT domain-containing protein
MFETAQWAQSSEAAQSLRQMGARGAKGDPRVAARARDRQDLVAEWQQRDAERTAAVAQLPDKRNPQVEVVNMARLTEIDAKIAEIDKRLAAEFPDYAALVSPDALSVEGVQSLLGSDEALILMLDTPELKPTPEETFIWVVTKTGEPRWVRSELGTAALTREVKALRCGLDNMAWDPKLDDRCTELLNVKETLDDVPLPFPHARAHALYKSLFGQIEEVIKDKKHLLIVPSGALTQMPFHVLVTAPPPAGADHRSVAWLARSHAITVLPAVSSLKALRRDAKPSAATKPYLGIGNPLLDGPQDDPNITLRTRRSYQKRAQLARERQQCPKNLMERIASVAARPLPGFAKLFRGPNADIDEVRHWPPLPETADELCVVGRQLGVPESEILLGANATETKLKERSAQGQLADYAILHFATHGALAGQVQSSAEPGLILTPPKKGTTDAESLERDDGFLTASEIATLKLNADWVVLSACNTAGAQSENAEALSGMGRAFFYAGARAVLVSHWEVNSLATVKLITSTVRYSRTLGRAEALRQAMLNMIDGIDSKMSHPAYWAPFVVVGEGAARVTTNGARP